MYQPLIIAESFFDNSNYLIHVYSAEKYQVKKRFIDRIFSTFLKQASRGVLRYECFY